VFVDTPWVELYRDLPNVHPVRPARMRYRTQAKNLARLDAFPWATPPADCERAYFTYALRRPGSILAEMEKYVSLEGRALVFDLPDFGPSPVVAAKPVAVLRPVTIRAEWTNTARAPDPRYIAQAATVLRHAGFHVVAVADLEDGAEWLAGPMPEADEYFVRGELSVTELLALTQSAAVVVGGSGFIIPAAIAQGTPLVVIGGGQGAHNHPERVTDPRMDLSAVRFVLPDRYCPCTSPRHACDKAIADFPQRFRAALFEAVNARKEVAA
jgi:ADP-heptose:LPS heptosyltransferase